MLRVGSLRKATQERDAESRSGLLQFDIAVVAW